jgi:hypothetical protein
MATPRKPKSEKAGRPVINRKRRRTATPKRPVGRPTKYSAAVPQLLVDHFADRLLDTEGRSVPFLREIGVDLPTLGSFAREIEVSIRTIHNWKDAHEEFAEACESAQRIQEDMLESMTLKGVWVPSMAMFSLKYRHGWIDKTVVDTNTNITLNFDEVDKDA